MIKTGKLMDLVGKRFGKFTVVSFSHTNKDSFWNVVCDCGNERVVMGSNLKKGLTKSCGCLREENKLEYRLHGDFIGKKFHYLTVIKFSHVTDQGCFWECLCDCGNVVTVLGKSLNASKTKSCGCLRTEKIILAGLNNIKPAVDKIGNKYGKLTVIKYYKKIHSNHYWTVKCECGKEKNISEKCFNTRNSQHCTCSKKKTNPRHGLSRCSVYHIWKKMLSRCYNVNDKNYNNYGGRGISVCDKWKTIAGFYEDVGDRPPNMSLDRINNDGNYCKENCRWATGIVQQGNRRVNLNVKFKGEIKNVAEWSRTLGINKKTLYIRLWRGWTIDKAFNC